MQNMTPEKIDHFVKYGEGCKFSRAPIDVTGSRCIAVVKNTGLGSDREGCEFRQCKNVPLPSNNLCSFHFSRMQRGNVICVYPQDFAAENVEEKYKSESDWSSEESSSYDSEQDFLENAHAWQDHHEKIFDSYVNKLMKECADCQNKVVTKMQDVQKFESNIERLTGELQQKTQDNKGLIERLETANANLEQAQTNYTVQKKKLLDRITQLETNLQTCEDSQRQANLSMLQKMKEMKCQEAVATHAKVPIQPRNPQSDLSSDTEVEEEEEEGAFEDSSSAGGGSGSKFIQIGPNLKHWMVPRSEPIVTTESGAYRGGQSRPAAKKIDLTKVTLPQGVTKDTNLYCCGGGPSETRVQILKEQDFTDLVVTYDQKNDLYVFEGDAGDLYIHLPNNQIASVSGMFNNKPRPKAELQPLISP